jgi:hypothetical protein
LVDYRQQPEVQLDADVVDRLSMDLRELVASLGRVEREPSEIDAQGAKLNKLRGLTVQEIQLLQKFQKLLEEVRQLQDTFTSVCCVRADRSDTACAQWILMCDYLYLFA